MEMEGNDKDKGIDTERNLLYLDITMIIILIALIALIAIFTI